MKARTTLNNRNFLRLLLLAMAAVWMSCACRAQNNSYKIKDELYNMYVDAYRDRTTMRGLQLSTRMYNRAVMLDDRKAQCLAYTLPVSYYFYQREQPVQFDRAVKQLQTIAQKFGMMQYYYFAFSNRVNYLINQKRMDEAVKYVHETEDFANSQKDVFGMYTCLCAHGQINIGNREIFTGLRYFQEAQKMASQLLPDIDLANLYRKMAECYADLYKYHDMFAYALKAYQTSRTTISRQRTIRSLCYAAMMLDREDDFMKYYNVYLGIKQKVDPDSRDTEERDIAILKFLHDRDFENAYKYIMKRPRILSRSRLLVKYYSMTGNLKALSEEQKYLYHVQIRDCDSVRSQNFDGTYARFLNLRLDMQNQRLGAQRQQLENERQATELKTAHLKLANTQLTLRNSSLELSRTKSESDILRMSYRKKMLEAEKLRSDLRMSKMNQELGNMLSTLGAAMGVLSMVGIGFYLWSRARLMIDLRETNSVLEHNHQQLTLAKEHAEAANNVKTAFIQTMGAEIRSPLNEIVRLSNAIADSGGKASRRELAELSELINSNTERLLNIVSNVLKKV